MRGAYMSGGIAACRICGIAIGGDMNSIEPTLCRWCETSYGRMLDGGNGRELALWVF